MIRKVQGFSNLSLIESNDKEYKKAQRQFKATDSKVNHIAVEKRKASDSNQDVKSFKGESKQ